MSEQFVFDANVNISQVQKIIESVATIKSPGITELLIVISAASGATLNVVKSSRGILKFFKVWFPLTGSVLPVFR